MDPGLLQASLRHRVAARLGTPAIYPEGRFSGRGIVLCAGGLRYFTCAWVLIWLLRRVHCCSLPIQVWHLGRSEMSEGMRLILEEEGVEVVDADSVIGRHPARVSRGWPLKPYAIAHSRFREVLYLDADTVPLVDPEVVFDWSGYGNTGAVFWPDNIDVRKENPVWNTLGLEPRDHVSFESGILAVDKQHVWNMLDLAILLNEHWEELYDLIHGDKDSFLLSCLLLGQSYDLIDHRPFNFDIDLVQRNPDGDPFLHHRTGSKWSLTAPNRPVVNPALDKSCDEALADLRRRWTGAIFHAPDRSIAALAEETALIAVRRFQYTTGLSGRTLELLSGGRVGAGRAECEQHWAVIERDGTVILQFFSHVSLTVELVKVEDGSWCGQSMTSPAFEARIVSERDAQSWPHAGEQRITRSAQQLIGTLLDPALFAAGFQADTERELNAALSLVNRLFDDVPEQLTTRIASANLESRWRNRLENLARTLASDRDRRLALSGDHAAHPVVIDPARYSRVT